MVEVCQCVQRSVDTTLRLTICVLRVWRLHFRHFLTSKNLVNSCSLNDTQKRALVTSQLTKYSILLRRLLEPLSLFSLLNLTQSRSSVLLAV